jgi:hypothetical protein
MQTFQRVKDVVEYSKHIHSSLERLFQGYRDQNQEESVTMMLDYLINEQHRMKDVLSNFEETNQLDNMDTWMQYAPSLDISQATANQPIKADITLDELIDVVDEFGKAVVAFYREAVKESELPKVTELFENLAEMETKNTIKQLKASVSMV